MPIFKQGELKILWPFYLSGFIAHLLDVVSYIWVIFYASQGLSFVEIGILTAAVVLGNIIFEIPTGAIADLFGRKYSVIFGMIGGGISLSLVPLAVAGGFWWIMLIALLFAFFVTIVSGADEAWVMDLLKKHKKSELEQNYFINEMSIAHLGLFIAGIAGMFIIDATSLGFLYYVAGVGMIIGALILFLAEDDDQPREKIEARILSLTWRKSKAAIIYMYNNKVLFYLTLASFIFYLEGIVWVAWQPYLLNVGLAEKYFPLLGSAAALLTVFIPHITRKLKKFVPKPHILIGLTVSVAGVLYLGFYFFTGLVFAIFCYIMQHSVLPAIGEPVESHYFQQHAVSSMRATLSSVNSMIIAVPGFISLIIGGAITEYLGPQTALISAGFILIPSAYFYLQAKE